MLCLLLTQNHEVDVNGQVDGVKPSEKFETVRLLIERGMTVTAKDGSLSTPLHLASSWGSLEIMKLLIESGADVTEKDGSGRTPLHLASSWVSAKVRVTLVMSHMLDRRKTSMCIQSLT